MLSNSSLNLFPISVVTIRHCVNNYWCVCPASVIANIEPESVTPGTITSLPARSLRARTATKQDTEPELTALAKPPLIFSAKEVSKFLLKTHHKVDLAEPAHNSQGHQAPLVAQQL